MYTVQVVYAVQLTELIQFREVHNTPSYIVINYTQARVQEFVRGRAQNVKPFFFAFQFFRGGASSENS